jgi:hypothetical protein
MPNAIDTQIRATIDQFVAEISQLVRQAAVAAVSGALGQGGTSAPARRKTATRAPTRPKVGRPKGKRVRRSSADLEAQGAKILAHVRANAGCRMEDLSAALGTPTKDLRRPVTELIEAGKLRTEGQKRGTQYFAGGGGARKKKTTRKKATRRKAKRAKRKTAKKAT